MRSASGYSFEQLCVPHRAELMNFARRLTANGHQAEDLVQEAYVKALSAWSEFVPDGHWVSNPERAAKAWLYRIVGNLFVNNERDMRLHRIMHRNQYPKIVSGLYGEVDAVPIPTSTQDPEQQSVAGTKTNDYPSMRCMLLQQDGLTEDNVSKEVLTAINRLAPKRREAIRRYYFQGESCETIAAALGIPTSSVRSLLMRARTKLAPLLERFARVNYELGGAGVSTEGEPTKRGEPNTYGIKGIMRKRHTCTFNWAETAPDHATAG